MIKNTSAEGSNIIVMICSYCKKTLNCSDDEESVKAAHNQQQISHGICPDCLLEHFPAEYIKIQEEYRMRIKYSYRRATAQQD